MSKQTKMKRLKRYIELRNKIFDGNQFVELDNQNKDHIEYQKLIGDKELIELIKMTKKFKK